MPRLSEEVKLEVVFLREMGWSWKQITVRTNVKKSTAQAVCKKKIESGTVSNKEASGRPRKINERGNVN